MPVDDRQRLWRLAARYSTLGIEMVASLTIGALGGQWLDSKLETTPWLLWLGIVVGFGAAISVVIRAVKQVQRDMR